MLPILVSGLVLTTVIFIGCITPDGEHGQNQGPAPLNHADASTAGAASRPLSPSVARSEPVVQPPPGACLKWDLGKPPELKSAFHDQPDMAHAFPKKFHDDAAGAVRDWVLSSPTYHGISPVDVAVKSLGKGGGAVNEGIFSITVKNSQRNIVKIASCDEAAHLVELNQSAIMYEQCISEKLPDVKSAARFPRIAAIVDAASIPGDAHKCLQLLNVAPGQQIGDLPQSANLKEAYTNIGESFAILHRLGWAHYDANSRNVFYDIPSGHCTLIDNGKLGPTGNLEGGAVEDISQAIGASTNYAHDLLQKSMTWRMEDWLADKYPHGRSGDLPGVNDAIAKLVTTPDSLSETGHTRAAQLNDYAGRYRDFLGGYLSLSNELMRRLALEHAARLCLHISTIRVNVSTERTEIGRGSYAYSLMPNVLNCQQWGRAH